MAKYRMKTKYTTEESMEACTRRESDESGDENTEEGSEMYDSEAEALLQEGEDITPDKRSPDVDSDNDWEPDAPPVRKRPCREEEQQDGASSGDKLLHPTPQRGSACRRRGRGRGKGSSVQDGSSAGVSEESWNDDDIPDITPPQPTFIPTRSPGPQLVHTAAHTPLQLFHLFFTPSIVSTVTQNTNDYGSSRRSKACDRWIELTVQDIYAFMAMVVYMGLVKCCSFTDYWRGGQLYSFPHPRQVMSGNEFLRIRRFLHLSSLAADAANEEGRGTAAFDRLCKIKPLYQELREACRTNYHPNQEIAMYERMVASRARTGPRRCMTSKPVHWGYKMCVLADSRSGFMWDFIVYEGKHRGDGGKGLGCESVMELVDTPLLGTGYKLFVDNFYTSPALFRDLLQRQIWACGTIRTNSVGYPKTKVNGLTTKYPRGSIRWIGEDPLLFVQWRDTRDAFLCSTLHTAHEGETEQRRAEAAGGRSKFKDIPVPLVVKEYNQCMGRVHVSNASQASTHHWEQYHLSSEVHTLPCKNTSEVFLLSRAFVLCHGSGLLQRLA